MFPDGHFIVHEQGKDVAGSYRIEGRKLSRTVILERAAGKNTDWSPGPATGQQHATLDHEITLIDNDSLTLMPGRSSNQIVGRADETGAETCVTDLSMLKKYEAMRRAIPVSQLPAPNYELGSGAESGKDGVTTKQKS